MIYRIKHREFTFLKIINLVSSNMNAIILPKRSRLKKFRLEKRRSGFTRTRLEERLFLFKLNKRIEMDSRARSENTVRGGEKSGDNQLSSSRIDRESELVSVKIDFSRISLADQSVRGIEAGKSMDDRSMSGWRQICNLSSGKRECEKSRDLRSIPIAVQPSIKKRTAMRVGIIRLSLSLSLILMFTRFLNSQ